MGMRSWPEHDRQLTIAAEQARAAARHVRDSLRWNPRAKSERAIPRPDGAVIDTLEELTARTRAIARSLADIRTLDRPCANPSFAEDYAALLRILTGPVRQLADQRTSQNRKTLNAAASCQRHLEGQAAKLPHHDDARSVARRLTCLTSQILSEVAEHQDRRDPPESRVNGSP